MSDLKRLEAGLDAALQHLAASAKPPSIPPTADTAALTQLQDENRALTEKLATLKAQRDQDLAQLDELLAQLRPLIEEAV